MTPACWSWTVPPVIDDVEAEIARRVAETEAKNALLPLDERRTPEVWRHLLRVPEHVRFDEFHDRRCALCGDTTRDLMRDHDHRTGLVRGMLCRACNSGEGRGRSDFYQAYRERNPATILDYWAYYSGFGWPPGWWRNPARARRLTGDPGWALIERAVR